MGQIGALAPVSTLLQRGWNINANARVLCSDLRSLTVFYLPSISNLIDVRYEITILVDDLAQLRIIIAAYLYDAFLEDLRINCPTESNSLDLRLPSGASNDPLISPKSDEEVFAAHHRHSDFDFYSLTHDRAQALQFFRWKEHIRNRLSPKFASSGDTLLGATWAFARLNYEMSPCFTMNEEDLLVETINHIRSVNRPCPMASMIRTFMSSSAFSIRLLKDLTSRFPGGRCRTYTCRIVSIEEQGVENVSPILCVRLFDDRFLPMEPPNKELIETGPQSWWRHFATAEGHVRNEDAAYQKLELIQGSLIPRFYGSHLVSCDYCL